MSFRSIGCGVEDILREAGVTNSQDNKKPLYKIRWEYAPRGYFLTGLARRRECFRQAYKGAALAIAFLTFFFALAS